MNKILITGGAGFMGLHLTRLLLPQARSIDLLDNFSRGAEDESFKALTADPKITLLKADLTQSSHLIGLSDDYDLIFHMAAILGVQNVLNRPYDVLSDNTLMTMNMLKVARNQRALKRFLFFSTSEVYAGTLKHFTLPIPTPESTPLALTDLEHPRTSYMLSKLYGEALCHQSDVPFTIVRPHNVYGPRMGLSHVIPELLKKAHQAPENGELEVFSMDHRRTFCYVDDAVTMIQRAAEAPGARGRTLNIGTQHPEFTIGELARVIMAVTGKNLTLRPKPPTPGSPERRCPDLSLTRDLLGYTAAVSLDEGVRKTFDWYKAHCF